jgi:hypothetical protein
MAQNPTPQKCGPDLKLRECTLFASTLLPGPELKTMALTVVLLPFKHNLARIGTLMLAPASIGYFAGRLMNLNDRVELETTGKVEKYSPGSGEDPSEKHLKRVLELFLEESAEDERLLGTPEEGTRRQSYLMDGSQVAEFLARAAPFDLGFNAMLASYVLAILAAVVFFRASVFKVRT